MPPTLLHVTTRHAFPEKVASPQAFHYQENHVDQNHLCRAKPFCPQNGAQLTLSVAHLRRICGKHASNTTPHDDAARISGKTPPPTDASAHKITRSIPLPHLRTSHPAAFADVNKCRSTAKEPLQYPCILQASPIHRFFIRSLIVSYQ